MSKARPTPGVAPDTAGPSADRIVRIAAFLLITAIVLAGLTYGAPILVPVAEAFLVWFIVNALADALRTIPKYGEALTPGTALLIAALIVVTIGIAIIYSGVRSISFVGPQALRLQTSLDPLVGSIAQLIGIEAATIIDRMMDAIGIEALMREVAIGLLNLVNQFGLVAIYVAFLLVDQSFFPDKLRILFPDERRRKDVSGVLSDLSIQIRSYLWIMTRVSAATAGLSYIVMLAIGLEGALFWASLVFFLNFIPTLGSILATILPIAVALVQFQDIATPALLGLLLGAIQFVLGNIVLPRMTGNTLNLSLFVTILCLVFWGAVWGITGMFLAVPLTAIFVLVASKFESTKAIATILSRTGTLAKSPEEPDASGGESPPPKLP